MYLGGFKDIRGSKEKCSNHIGRKCNRMGHEMTRFVVTRPNTLWIEEVSQFVVTFYTSELIQ